MKAFYCLIIIGALLCCAGCADQSPAPEAIPEATTPEETMSPAATDSPPPKEVVWNPDGTVSEGEYADSFELSGGRYAVYWTNDEEDLYMALRGEVTGWVAIGFEPTSEMKDADMVFGWVENGNPVIQDQFSTGSFGPHIPDKELGGSDDILEFGGSEEDGVTVVEFHRSMDTGDQFDKAFATGQTVRFIWGLATTDSASFKHNAGRGSAELKLN
jgi:hypothetical protein